MCDQGVGLRDHGSGGAADVVHRRDQEREPSCVTPATVHREAAVLEPAQLDVGLEHRGQGYAKFGRVMALRVRTTATAAAMTGAVWPGATWGCSARVSDSPVSRSISTPASETRKAIAAAPTSRRERRTTTSPSTEVTCSCQRPSRLAGVSRPGPGEARRRSAHGGGAASSEQPELEVAFKVGKSGGQWENRDEQVAVDLVRHLDLAPTTTQHEGALAAHGEPQVLAVDAAGVDRLGRRRRPGEQRHQRFPGGGHGEVRVKNSCSTASSFSWRQRVVVVVAQADEVLVAIHQSGAAAIRCRRC